MDEIRPAPDDDPRRTAITERNIAAVWANYTALGRRRLIYTNPVSILEEPMISRAMGGDGTRATCVLLTASEAAVKEPARWARNRVPLAARIERNLRVSRHLDEEAPVNTARIPTDGRSVQDIAQHVLQAAAW